MRNDPTIIIGADVNPQVKAGNRPSFAFVVAGLNKERTTFVRASGCKREMTRVARICSRCLP